MARRKSYGRSGYDQGYGSGGMWPEYVSVAQKRADALAQAQKLAKKGRVVQPVKLEGRAIATTFWGKAWCTNLESYADYANRLDRGRSYVRHGCVIDLGIYPRKVTALVNGSALYEIAITIEPLPAERRKRVVDACTGRIDSLVELLKGRLDKGVMDVITHKGDGLFPTPRELKMRCSCPDHAGLCKHLAAALYGIGARLDADPGLLFVLREIDPAALIGAAATAAAAKSGAKKGGGARRTLAASELGDVFGIDVEMGAGVSAGVSAADKASARGAKPRASAKVKAVTKGTAATKAKAATTVMKAGAKVAKPRPTPR